MHASLPRPNWKSGHVVPQVSDVAAEFAAKVPLLIGRLNWRNRIFYWRWQRMWFWLQDFASICVRYDAFLESVRLKGLFGYFEEVLQDHCNKGLVQGMMVCFMKISTFLHGFFQSYNQFAFDWILHNRIQVIFVFKELDNLLIQFLPDFFFSLFLRFLATCVQNLGIVFT